AELSHLAASGRTSVQIDPAVPHPLYRIVGYKIAGSRAVRVDILERLADLIRPLIAWRPTPEMPDPPPGAIHGYGFTTTVAMTSLLGCSGEDFASVLRALGYRAERKPAPAKLAPALPAAATPAEAAEAQAEPPAEPADMPAAEATSLDEPAGEPPAKEPQTPGEETPQPAAADSEIGPAPAAAEMVAPAEPAFIEIWRPGRRDRGEPPRHRRPERRPAIAAGDPTRPPGGQLPAHAAAPTDAGPSTNASRDVRPDRSGRPQRDDRQHRGRQHGDGKPAQRPDRTARRHGDGKDRPRREKQSGEAMRFSTEPPKGDRQNKVPDPNSPFAALAALKAELEAKERGG
ncbi:MAG: helicase, partial [Bauldia sp.]|nr:helicase [Bauldia sp.]